MGSAISPSVLAMVTALAARQGEENWWAVRMREEVRNGRMTKETAAALTAADRVWCVPLRYVDDTVMLFPAGVSPATAWNYARRTFLEPARQLNLRAAGGKIKFIVGGAAAADEVRAAVARGLYLPPAPGGGLDGDAIAPAVANLDADAVSVLGIFMGPTRGQLGLADGRIREAARLFRLLRDARAPTTVIVQAMRDSTRLALLDLARQLNAEVRDRAWAALEGCCCPWRA